MHPHRDLADALLALGSWLLDLAEAGPASARVPDLIRALDIVKVIGRDRDFFETVVNALSGAALEVLAADEIAHEGARRRPVASALEAQALRRKSLLELVETTSTFIVQRSEALQHQFADDVGVASQLQLARCDAQLAVTAAVASTVGVGAP